MRIENFRELRRKIFPLWSAPLQIPYNFLPRLPGPLFFLIFLCVKQELNMSSPLDKTAQKEILKQNFVGHLAFIDGAHPYVLPITYWYDPTAEQIISYASDGHKTRSMRLNPSVCLCVDEILSVSEWRSVLVHGEYQEIKGSDAKFLLHRFAEGVKEVISQKEHKNPQFIHEFSSKMQSEKTPIVYRLKITEMTGRSREGN